MAITYNGKPIKTDNLNKILRNTIIGIILVTLFFGSFYTVAAGERGILLTFNKPSDDVKGEGLHFKIPLVQRVDKLSIQTMKYEADAPAASKDLQIVHTKIAVNYHLSESSLISLYRELGRNYQDKVIQPAVQEVVKQSTAQFTAEELITHRDVVKDKIDLLLKERLQSRGIYMETTSITNFDFSEEFNRAIESKVTAEQLALKAQRDLERITIEAQQKVAEAKGKAEAITIESEALRNNPQVLELRALEKWNGILPQVTGGAIPFVNLEVSKVE